MAILRGLSKYIGSLNSRRHIYNSIKLDSNGKFYLDNNNLHRNLEVEGISEYANTTIPILKKAVEEIKDGLNIKTVPQSSNRSVASAALWYMIGASTFYFSIDRWRHSRFFGDA